MQHMSGMRQHLARGVAMLAAVAVGVGVLSGCGSADLDDAPLERKTFPFGGERLRIESDDSELEITAADVDEVEVTRRVDGWVVIGNGPDASWKLEDGTLRLTIGCKGLAAHCAGHHTVKVPRGVSVTVEDGNGGVEAGGFADALTIRSDNGRVVVRDSSGPLVLETRNGGIRTERVTSTRVRAHSGNGSVRLDLDAAPERVESSSNNGGVDVRLPAGGGPYAVTAESRNGGVDVSVPTDDASERSVTARSGNGKVRVGTAN